MHKNKITGHADSDLQSKILRDLHSYKPRLPINNLKPNINMVYANSKIDRSIK